MTEKLRLVYETVEEPQAGLYIVGHGGRRGLILNGRVRIPVKYHHIYLIEQFIVAGVSEGFGYAAIFNRDAQRLIPPPGSKQELAEFYSVSGWEGVGLILLTRDPPTYKNPMKLVLLRNDGALKSYEGVERLPLMVTGTRAAAIVAPGAKPDVRGLEITPERCAGEMRAGNILEVLDADFRVLARRGSDL